MTFEGRCPARAAIAGNPSDGYGGFVVAVPVASVAATATAQRSDRFEIVHSPTGDDTFDDLDSLIEHVDRFGADDARRLVLATIRALARHHDVRLDPLRIGVETTIPRSVGLAGSSAIVVATLRALAAASGGSAWVEALGEPDALAVLAHSVERDELGIAAGLQDRLVQSHGVPVAMDFSPSATRPIGRLRTAHTDALPGVPGRLIVAYRQGDAEPSGVVHAGLRDRYDADVATTRSTMDDIARQGRRAADAIRAGDVVELGRAMDRTLDLRAELLDLDHRLVAAARDVRGVGAHVNWSGSGGAITVLLPDGVETDEVRRRLTSDHACRILDV